jgi:predicted nucleotide-binding protein
MIHSNKLRILLVEDTSSMLAEAEHQLRGAFSELQLEVITCESDFRDALPRIVADPPSLFIIDMILRWTTPRVPMPARPSDAMTPFRAGARCIRSLLDKPETDTVPILIHSVLEPAEITELSGLPDHVMYVRKGSDLAGFVRSALQEAWDEDAARRRVFVVHGHDHLIRNAVVDVLTRLDLEPIVLAEQATASKTFLELIEQYAKVGFAVVLLTADDLGRAKTDQRPKKRPRQNVILELGYFLAKLGRNRVCSLFEPGVEMPTDYQAVKYLELDRAGNWRKRLAEEIASARIPIDVSRIS